MIDFDAYVEEVIEMARQQRNKIPSGEPSKISKAYHTGYIYGLRASKLIFKEYEQKSRGDGKVSEPDEPVEYADDMYDDADALASAGHGTDEDYGYYGEEY